MYSPYITYQEYVELGGNTLTAENADKYLKTASRNLDVLTFNRIHQMGGINKLTQFQQDIVKEFCANVADFVFENEEVLDNILSSYSINGVSMNFSGNWNLTIREGVAVRTDDFKLLESSGLCYLGYGYNTRSTRHDLS